MAVIEEEGGLGSPFCFHTLPRAPDPTTIWGRLNNLPLRPRNSTLCKSPQSVYRDKSERWFVRLMLTKTKITQHQEVVAPATKGRTSSFAQQEQRRL